MSGMIISCTDARANSTFLPRNSQRQMRKQRVCKARVANTKLARRAASCSGSSARTPRLPTRAQCSPTSTGQATRISLKILRDEMPSTPPTTAEKSIGLPEVTRPLCRRQSTRVVFPPAALVVRRFVEYKKLNGSDGCKRAAGSVVLIVFV